MSDISHVTKVVKRELGAVGADYTYTPPTSENDEIIELETTNEALNFLIRDYELRNFVAANVLSFTISNNIVEVGESLPTLTASWTIEGTGVTTATVSGVAGTYGNVESNAVLTLDTAATRTTTGSLSYTVTSGLDAEGGQDNANASLNFRRKIYIGATSKTSGFVSSDLNTATFRDLDTNQFASTSVSPSNEYIFVAFATEHGGNNSIVVELDGVPADFQYVETISHTNETGNGAADTNYLVFRSENQYNASVAVQTITTTPRLYFGSSTEASPTINEAWVEALAESEHVSFLNNWTDDIDLSGSNYWYIAIPASFGTPFTAYSFWDAPDGGFNFAMTDMGQTTITGIDGSPITYNVLRTSNNGLGSGIFIEIRV
jgi:hypothetical protein